MSSIAKKLMSAASGNVGAWDLSYAYYDPATAWDVSTANFSKQIAANILTGLFFKPDGTKFYALSGATLTEYNTSTAWDVNNFTIVQNVSVSAQETTPQNVSFKPDGLKMYILGQSGRDVSEYDLSTAWDISTSTFLQSSPSLIGQDGNPRAFFFRTDGLKMYMVGIASDRVYEYNLSTAWDVSTLSLVQNFSIAAQETVPRGLSFKPDGTKMYVIGSSGDDVNEYNLSTAWDVSSASFLQLFSVAAQAIEVTGFFFKPDGTAMFVADNNTRKLYQYTLGGFIVSAQETAPSDVFFKPDGTKMYVMGLLGDDVNEYNLSTPWDVSSASFLQLFSVLTQESSPFGLDFKPDGTKMYVTGNVGDDVNAYDLSTAWDISTAVYVQRFSVSAQEAAPVAVRFKSDGTRMYIAGAAGLDINEYSLSTAWNISTASYVRNFSVSGQMDLPRSIFFKPDGQKMYVTATQPGKVYEYDLSTAWDISTASFLQSLTVSPQDESPLGVYFKDDGTQMFIIGNFTQGVYSYTLGVQP